MRIRHKTTAHELDVPDTALEFYPDYEPVTASGAPARKRTTRKRSTAKRTTRPTTTPSEANPPTE